MLICNNYSVTHTLSIIAVIILILCLGNMSVIKPIFSVFFLGNFDNLQISWIFVGALLTI